MASTQILIVEDERIVGLNLRQLLGKLGYGVSGIASNGEQALKLVDEQKPNLVLMDIHIGGKLDGIEVASRLPSNLLIPVIYLTAYSDEQTLERARATKPYGYLLKPFGERELHASIQMALARRDAEAARWEAEERVRLTLDAAEMGPWELSPTEGTILCSDKASEIFGLAADETSIAIERLLERVAGDHRQEVSQRFAELATTDEPQRFEFPLYFSDDRLHRISVRGKPFFGLLGERKRVIGVVRDVTARRRAEEALHASEDLHRSMVAALGEGILLCQADAKVSMCNAAAESIFGVAAEKIIGRDFLREVEALREDGKLMPIAHHPALETLTTGASVRGKVEGIRRPDGEIRWVSVNAEPLRRDGEAKPYAMVASFTDITDLRQAEERLLQAQKLEAIGQLTGGIAHDFNNLLTVILGSSETLVDQLSSTPRLRALAELTRTAAERGAALTNRLLAFARRQALEPKAIDVADLIAGMSTLLKRTLGEHIEIQVHQSGALWKALIDPTQLEAAVLNLCINARDAMPAGGKLTVEIANATLDRAYADQHKDVTPGEYVMVAVADMGCGMSPEVVNRAFEPFFTTKGIGKGSGLGLSMVYGFVKQSGGHIKIYSEVGHGTIVKLYLPRAGRKDANETSDTAAGDALCGSESILVVEDDDLVRAHVETHLRQLGYQVIAVRNGPDALKTLQATPEIDLLFTDVVMPGGINGRELANAARRIRPGLRVLYTSGYTENVIVHHGRLDRGVVLLNKPYHRQELAAKVRQALNGAETAGDGPAQPRLL